MANLKEASHIAKRFVIHYFSAFGVLLIVMRFASEPLSHAGESISAKALGVAFVMAAVAIKEIFDVNKLAELRGYLIANILKTGACPPKHKLRAALTDPRYTLKKRMYDLAGWGPGVATALILL